MSTIAIARAKSISAPIAICSHGDVIPETLDALVRRGCEITSIPDWRKASVWVLERGSEGEVVSAEAWPPPDSAG